MSQTLNSRPWPRGDVYFRKWYPCWWCGENAETYEVVFVGGGAEPVVGETITGSSSGSTGVVNSVALEGGGWYSGSDYIFYNSVGDIDPIPRDKNGEIVFYQSGGGLDDVIPPGQSVPFWTATGTITMSSVTGTSSDKLTAFEKDDVISGSVSGPGILTLSEVAIYKNYGRMYPDSELAFRDGHYWCRPHYDMKYRINDWADWAKSDRIMEDNE